MKFTGVMLMSIFFIGNVIAEDAHHQHKKEHSEATSVSLNNGKKWNADATMKKNMESIEKKIHEIHKLISTKKVTNADYVALSDLLVSSSQDIIKNCKLEPKADETFHTAVLAPMLDAANELKNKDQQKSGLEKVKHALAQYSQYFETH